MPALSTITINGDWSFQALKKNLQKNHESYLYTSLKSYSFVRVTDRNTSHYSTQILLLLNKSVWIEFSNFTFYIFYIYI